MMDTLRLTVVLGVTTLVFGQDAVVQRSSVYTDTVKRGAMTRAVRGPAVLVGNNIAEVSIPAAQVQEIRPGQPADIDTGRGGVVKGKVTRVLPIVANGAAKVEVQAERTLPEAHPTLDVLVQLEVLNDVLYVGRPAVGPAQAEGVLFKLDGDGQHATKVNVQYGRASVNNIEVLSGLRPGDQVILSDMSSFATKDRVRLQ
jgi:HlyD family secretion protein